MPSPCRGSIWSGSWAGAPDRRGWTCELPAKANETLENRTDRTWPTTWFAPRLTGKGAFADVYSVMNNWGANHGAFSYGHIGNDLIALAALLRIPVCMHNVPDGDVFRPTAWNAFGTSDLEAADYLPVPTSGRFTDGNPA